nr:MAG TPA: hypothetical protein [Caudoviricetes sp.]
MWGVKKRFATVAYICARVANLIFKGRNNAVILHQKSRSQRA